MTTIRQRRLSSEQLMAWFVVGATTAFVLWQLYPEYLVRNTTPVFGDLADHLMAPAHLRDHLLPNWRLTGWSQAWFTGYPSLVFYFPLPNILIVLLDVALPYNVAFKLTAAAGPISLPVIAYAFGRCNERSRLTSACFGASTLVVLLQPLLWRLGGSIGSAAVGEFSYGLSMSFGLLTLAVAGVGLRTGRYRALTASLLAACLLSHVVPVATVFVGLAVLTVRRPSWAKIRWTATVLLSSIAVSGFWLFPLLLRLRFTAGPDAEKTASWAYWLWPSEMAPIAILALLGLILTAFAASIGESSRSNDLEAFMAIMAVTSFLLFTVMPKMPVEDTRFLPWWFLWLTLSAANALARLAELVDARRAKVARGQSLDQPLLVRLVMPAVILFSLWPLWDSRFGKGILTASKASAVPYSRNFIGYEKHADRAEFQGYIDTMRHVGRTNGCGRSLSDWNNDPWMDDRLILVDLTPYWTNGCIPSARGVILQSSATSPYLLATIERLSPNPANVDGEAYEFDLAAGIDDLRLLGIRYFVAAHPQTRQAAAASPELRLVAETKPYDDHHWSIFEVRGVQMVEPLRYEPIVVPSIHRSRRTWERATQPWYDSGSNREVTVAADGPRAWQHERHVPTPLPQVPVSDTTTVSNVRVKQDRMDFDVSRTGTPVLVKMSYFPNWEAHGADGPWRVMPNHMVVVPRSQTVTLRYGRTPADHMGSLASLVGVGALAFQATRPPLEMPTPVGAHAGGAVAPSPPTRRKPTKPNRKKRRK